MDRIERLHFFTLQEFGRTFYRNFAEHEELATKIRFDRTGFQTMNANERMETMNSERYRQQRARCCIHIMERGHSALWTQIPKNYHHPTEWKILTFGFVEFSFLLRVPCALCRKVLLLPVEHLISAGLLIGLVD